MAHAQCALCAAGGPHLPLSHAPQQNPPPQTTAGEQYDLVLSSGFLAFANHSGFLQAVEEVRRCSSMAALQTAWHAAWRWCAFHAATTWCELTTLPATSKTFRRA